MMKNLRFFLPCLLVFFCGFTGPEKPWDELILGTWREHGDGYVEEKTFCSDGTANGWFEIWRTSSSGEKTLVEQVKFNDRWKIEDGYMICYDIKTEPRGVFGPDEKIRDRIIGITRTSFSYESEDGKICDCTKKM